MPFAPKAAIGCLVVGALGLLSSTTAYAAPGTAAVAFQGGGVIGPGLTALPAPQTIHFGGTATGPFANTGGADLVTVNCSFGGGSTGPGDNYAFGLGAIGGTCTGVGPLTGVPVTLNCPSVTYLRVGPVMVLAAAPTTCTLTIGAVTSSGYLAGALQFVPAMFPPAPITSYSLLGVAGFVGV